MNKKINILKVGLLADSEIASKYVFDLASWGQNQEKLKITHLITQKTAALSTNIFKKMLSKIKIIGTIQFLRIIGFRIIQKIEFYKLKKNKIHNNHLKKYNLKDIIEESIEIEPSISKSGLVYRYSESEINKILKLDLDILIRCGSGILKGEVLNSVRFGIISFHHADNTVNRGTPPGFWEVYLKQDSTGFTIQQLTEELDGGNVLYRGRIRTQPWYLLNQATIYLKSNYFLKKILNEIATNNSIPRKLESIPYCHPIYKHPGLRVQFKYFVYLLNRFLVGTANKYLFKRGNCWGVAFNYADWPNLAMWKSVKIKNPPNHFLADPFVFSMGQEDYCFVEDFNREVGKGCISVYKLYKEYADRLGEAIVEPFHMSYPYIFQYKNKLYMCPETCEKKEIRIYECEKLPLKWKLKKIIKTNVSAVDSTIFEWEGRWWLFTNIDSVNLGDRCSELHIFSSDNPLSDNWEPHAKNPVMVDSLMARMGGLYANGKVIYRVGQKQGFSTYGKSFSINKIIKLTSNEYIEKTITEITANFFPGLSGTHHMHSNGKITVFDYLENN